MPETINTQIADWLTAREFDVLRAGRRIAMLSFEQLRQLERTILTALREIDPSEPGTLAGRRRRLTQLLTDVVEPAIAEHYLAIREQAEDEARRHIESETQATIDSVNAMIGAAVLTGTVTVAAITALIDETRVPKSGGAQTPSATAREWWERQAEDLRRQLSDQLNASIENEETLTRMVQRVRGTPAQRQEDGVMARARRQIDTLAQTWTQALTEDALAEVYAANAEVIGAIEHQSVLDGRTCLAGETAVQTPNGPRPIAEIQQGDRVISGSGKETAVRATQQSRATCIIKVHFSDGSHVSCTPDHLFLTKDGWVEAQYLQNNQELMV